MRAHRTQRGGAAQGQGLPGHADQRRRSGVEEPLSSNEIFSLISATCDIEIRITIIITIIIRIRIKE